MSYELAIRLTEGLLGFALLVSSLEHFSSKSPVERIIFGTRLLAAFWIAAGTSSVVPLVGAWILSFAALWMFRGPYNGGSDRMGMLILTCLLLTKLAPTTQLKELAFGYLSLQVILSYFISGWVKVVNPDWRSGRALRDVFLFSAYPVSENLRGLADHPRLVFVAGWTVIILELAFPFTLLSAPTLLAALFFTASFHLANAVLFGLNRFFWVWLAAYPSLIWFQWRFVRDILAFNAG